MRQEINKQENKVALRRGMRTILMAGYMASSIMIVALPLYMRSIDFTETQIGIVVGSASFVSIFFSFIWGAVDNKYKHTQLLLRIIFCMLCIISILFSVTKVFVLFVGIRMLYEVFFCGFVPLSDKTSIQVEEYCGVPFNHLRAFGSLGYAIVLLPVLYFVEKFNNYQIIFFAMAACFIVALLATKLLDKISLLNKLDAEELTVHQPFLESLKILFTNKSFLLLVAVYVLMFTANDVSGAFQGIHITETLGAPKIIVSIAIFIAVGCSEVPLMFVVPNFQKKIGWYKCVLIAAVFFCIRFVLEGTITNWHLFLLVKLLHGIYISFFFAPILMLVRNTVPKSIYATAITILLALKGMGIAILSPLVGSLIEYTGTTATSYIIYTAMMLLAIVVLVGYQRKVTKEQVV